MKKLFTSALMMVATLVASAQSFTITAFGEETPIKDGETITCGYTLAGGGAIYTWNPELTLKANKDVSIAVTVSGHAVDGINAQFCGIDGQCKLLNNDESVTKAKPFTADQAEDLQIDIAMAMMPLSENLPVKVEVMAGTEIVNFTVIFTPDEQTEAGINSVSAAANRVSLSHRTLNYSVESTANLTLYTISGQSAISRRVSGNGSINLSDLPSGVYIYSLGSKTGKLIIR